MLNSLKDPPFLHFLYYLNLLFLLVNHVLQILCLMQDISLVSFNVFFYQLFLVSLEGDVCGQEEEEEAHCWLVVGQVFEWFAEAGDGHVVVVDYDVEWYVLVFGNWSTGFCWIWAPIFMFHVVNEYECDRSDPHQERDVVEGHDNNECVVVIWLG